VSEPELNLAMTAIAGQESRCGLCDGEIRKGGLIVTVIVDGLREWCHIECAEDER
jgi:hypothetical protein